MRHFLFLQGNASWYFRRLGEALAARGHAVTRVNVCGGDRLFWGDDDWNALDYSGRRDGFGPFLADLFARRGITDILLFGDTRTIHRAATAAARAAGVTVWVSEEGYLRPHWVTLERDGVNGFSRLPDDPAWYRETARGLGDFDGPSAVGPGMRQRILFDFRWQAANYLQAWRYPRFRTHRPYPIWAEYASWATRLAVLRRRQRAAEAAVAELLAGGRPFHLFPLQLDTDSQIRVHSPFGRLPAAIAAVMADFATHAPGDHLLVIKNHPLDNGWIHYPRLVARLARDLDIADRVRFIDGGDLNALIDSAAGTVTVNSTVGMTALERSRPAICLGHAIYDLPGLTFDGPLAAFWHGAPPPDAPLYEAFRRVVMHGCLVNGNFYTDPGVALAVEASLARLEGGLDLLADAPPRRGRPDLRVSGPATASAA